jgi:hypothetical protein
MRLTLRALLAYLYNVLDPIDADQFGEKVQESAVASGLVERIRGITHKTRMSAPRVDAKGLADDANNVAEYLDNCMSEEQVPDFERACINSDMHLAEVASSYQILTMVLGKPAEIAPHLRERIYTLPLEVAAKRTHLPQRDGGRARLKKTMEKVAAAKDAPADGGVTTSSTHAQPHVPDYLRKESPAKSRTWMIGAAILILAALALVILSAGPMDATHPVIGWMFSKDQVADSSQPGAGEVPAESGANKAETTSRAAAPSDTQAAATREPAETVEPMEKDSAEARIKDESAMAESTKTAPEAAPVGNTTPSPPADEGSDAKAAAAKAAAKPPLPVEVKPAESAEAKPVPAELVDVGRYISDDQVLIGLDARSGMWFRLPPRALLTAGQQLLALPTFRPQVALASGIQLTMAGESLARMDLPERPGASRISIDYGRFLLFTLGNAGAQVELDLHGLEGTLTMEDVDTEVAIEVRNYLPPGENPEEGAQVTVIELFLTAGRATWTVPEHEPIKIAANHVVTYVGGGEPTLAGPFRAPAWIDAASIPDIDRMTSPFLQKELGLEVPVHVRLTELLADRRVDMRALAARCLAQLDEFEPIIKELNNPQQKSFWAAEVDALRAALARGPETAQKLKQALGRIRPAEADALYRLLWGYSPQQLAGSAAGDLVEMLESQEMDIRVLASDNLRQITGAQLLYRPERRPEENRGPITQWNRRLKEGAIAYKTPPSPLATHLRLETPAEEGSKAKNGKAKAEPEGETEPKPSAKD